MHRVTSYTVYIRHIISSISPHLVYFSSSCIFHLILYISSHHVYFTSLVYFTSSRLFHLVSSISPRLVHFRHAPIGGRSSRREETNMFPAAHAQHRPSSFFIEDILLGRTKATATVGPVHRPSPAGLTGMTPTFGRPTYPVVSASAATAAAFNFEALFPSPLQFQPFALPSFGPKMGEHPFLLPTNSGKFYIIVYRLRVFEGRIVEICLADLPHIHIQYNTIQYNTIQYNTIQCIHFWCATFQKTRAHDAVASLEK